MVSLMMLKVKAFIAHIEEKWELDSWLLPGLSTALIFTLSFLLIPAFSPSNDDAYIERSLAGTCGVSSEPQPYTTTINIILGVLISRLYAFIPSVRWWIIIQLAVIYFALVFFGRVIITLLRVRKISNKWSSKRTQHIFELILISLVQLGLFSVFIPRLQFTNTSSLLISVAIFTTCIWRDEESKVQARITSLKYIPTALSVISFLYRPQSACIGFAIWVIVALISCKPRTKTNLSKNKRTSILAESVVLSISICLLLSITNTIATHISDQPIKEQFNEFSTWVDYPHPSYAQDPGLYKSVGWDEPLAELVDSWFMLDSRINPDTLGELNRSNQYYGLEKLVENPQQEIPSRLSIFLRPLTFAYYSIFSITAICLISVSNKGKRKTIVLLELLPLVLLVFLLFRGRLIERAVLAVLLPAISVNVSLLTRQDGLLDLYRCSKKQNISMLFLLVLMLAPFVVLSSSYLSKIFGLLSIGVFLALIIRRTNNQGTLNKCYKKFSAYGIGMAIACMLLLSSPVIASVRLYGWNSSDYADQSERLKNTEAFYKYVSSHDDTLYIYSGMPITVQYLWMDKWPNNQTGWGGWRYSYTWFDKAMKEVGLDGQPSSEDFLRDNVCFVSASDDTCNLLLCYMQEKFGDSVEMHQIDSITDEMKVYKFVYEEP